MKSKEQKEHSKEMYDLGYNQAVGDIKILIDEMDLELAIATKIIDTKTKETIEIPETIDPILDRYWEYIKKRIDEKITDFIGKEK